MDKFHFCYFENGLENDLFDKDVGNNALQMMLKSTFKI
jgi:hypothetical protein